MNALINAFSVVGPPAGLAIFCTHMALQAFIEKEAIWSGIAWAGATTLCLTYAVRLIFLI
jgi:hypothetical protein